MNQIEQLFGVDIKDINFIYLSDNAWYQINGSLEITGNLGQMNGKPQPQYFSAWCLRVNPDTPDIHKSLRFVGNVSQILLAEAEYS